MSWKHGPATTEAESIDHHESSMRMLQRLIDEHGDKPKAWEPPDMLDPANFDEDDWDSIEDLLKHRDYWQQRWKVRQKFRDHLVASDLPNHKKREYLETVQKVLDRLPTKVHMRMQRNVHGTRWFANKRDLTKVVMEMDPNLQVKSGVIGGCWAGTDGEGGGILFLDGDIHGPDKNGQGIYAHEFGHSVDWIPTESDPKPIFRRVVPAVIAREVIARRMRSAGFDASGDIVESLLNDKASLDDYGIQTDDLFRDTGVLQDDQSGYPISATATWQEAWKAELADNQLTEYGSSCREEGFAEFARLCWSTDNRPKEIEAAYPLCYAVFKAHGLV